MTSSEFDQFRPPRPERRGKRGDGKRDGAPKRRRPDDVMVPEAVIEHVDSYYGHPIVKPPPWEAPVGAYLVLGGIAGGSGLLAAGAQLAGYPALRRNARLAGLGAAGVGALALVVDLGRPERFLHMMRTFKVTSPMSVGSWILSGYSGMIGVAAAAEVDRLLGERLPLGPLRTVLRFGEAPAGLGAAVFATPLAAYTAVLLADTAMPTWNAAYKDLPFVFVSSASLAAGGLALVTTPAAEAAPARNLAVLGVIGDVAATRIMESRMDPVAAEPLHHGTPGKLMRWAERLAIAGGVGALLTGGRRGRVRRGLAALSGGALVAASACTRFGVFEAGLESAKDPRYTIEPQKRRLAARRAAGNTGDSITG
ncbi:Formate-dependent nitrite reductase, membrane component (plasmid) [Tsukamurella tyrosinosolvens]|uniref:Formate-dependent nitrite reductase, membrane component NrfD n=1 Tax=Tsukamurella tyrosinosolvens TaxID=57704 RepID=A0A1H4PLZ9_TSUTY|nr:NrfD/PsrC family molybdoenzyme membrane anchor subunit [Tsukamurella tyrosinosolvens]KXO97389.1 nitrite reductase [Tsukamurella tyrosinosolvens]SEC08202.1 Formate-dependent nitrite reductase, membrane component NrfD [Tsukamurella tyrosinosolvens]VEH97122.1 Formate-dependent nitrite reductase, membrane component [Tsukamurella tyrosinosolvens]